MKSLFIILLTCLIFPLNAQQQFAPFGFHQGMTLEEVIQATGQRPVEIDGNKFCFRSAPEPNPFFTDYYLTINSDTGVCAISAIH